jgi:hypothetical protein
LTGQDIVTALREDLPGNGFLRAHGINGDNGALDIQQFQQLGDRLYLVAPGVGLDLSKDQGIGRGKGAYHMNGGLPCGLVEAVPQGLAVYGDQRALAGFDQRFYPPHETAFKRLGLQQGKDPPKGVVGGNAMRQRQKSLEPGLLGSPKQRHFRPTVGTADHRTNRNDQQLRQFMPPPQLVPRIGQSAKRLPYKTRHPWLLTKDSVF